MPQKFRIQLDKLKRQKSFLVMLILLFVAVLFWVGVSIFSSQQRILIEAELIRLSQPLVPNIDRELMKKLAEREYFQDNQLEKFSIYVWQQDEVGEEGAAGNTVVDIVNQPTPSPENAQTEATSSGNLELETKPQDATNSGQETNSI